MTAQLLSLALPLSGWLLLMALASGAGLALVGAWPWAPGARAAGVALAAGLACAPLLAAFAAVVVMWALPGAAAAWQLSAIFAMLGVVTLVGVGSGATRRTLVPRAALLPRGPAAVLTWGFFAALLLDCAAVPLIQNDALEYATAGRILFDSRDLASYPVLQPQLHASGFFGPWTHPPLYVALLAQGFALQGGSEATVLMRLVAPWCLAGATACVAAMARWANPARPDAAALAALLLVSTPLLYLGAASALIDTLPVLGLALSLAAVAGLSVLASPWWQRALGIGVMLGLALWTHSQAVLVPLLILPLLFLQGPGRWPARLATALKVGVPALAIALLVGGAPYWRNVGLFGSPISDNPLIFALPALDWPGYFKLQRGLASTAELVQYGLLKPWFAIEAYAFVFWLALLVFMQGRQPLAVQQDSAVWLRPLCLGVIGLYLLGAVLSVALGVDLMVRNERYMLILLPAAAMLAAGAMNWPLLRGAMVVLIGLQLAVLLVYRLGQLNSERGAGEGARLQRWPPYAALSHLKQHTPVASVVFSMKPADMFYSARTMVSYLDPRLVPFYAEREPAPAAARLSELGVTHVHMPDYWLPPVYHSALAALLADPVLTDLAFEANGYQIYRLRGITDKDKDKGKGKGTSASASAGAGAGTGAGPGTGAPARCGEALNFEQWRRSREFVLGGRKNLWRVKLGQMAFAAGEESRSWNPTPLFLRETNTALTAEVALPKVRPAAAEWLLRLELEGEGYVQAHVHPRGAGVAPRLVGDRPLAGADVGAESGVLQRRFRIEAGAQRLDLRLEHRADSRLRVRLATLVPLCAP